MESEYRRGETLFVTRNSYERTDSGRIMGGFPIHDLSLGTRVFISRVLDDGLLVKVGNDPKLQTVTSTDLGFLRKNERHNIDFTPKRVRALLEFLQKNTTPQKAPTAESAAQQPSEFLIVTPANSLIKEHAQPVGTQNIDPLEQIMGLQGQMRQYLKPRPVRADDIRSIGAMHDLIAKVCDYLRYKEIREGNPSSSVRKEIEEKWNQKMDALLATAEIIAQNLRGFTRE